VSLNQIILWIMAVGILIGALDRMIGNKFGLGEKFEEGLNAMGPLALGMVGIITLAPLISRILGPIIFPIFRLIRCDLAMFATLLANDMGGYPLAMRLAQNQQAGLFAGLIVSSMLGCTLVFSIPVGLGLIENRDRPFSAGAAGIVITLATSIPVYKMMKDMNPKSKVMNVACLVPATAALGDHLGFTAAVRAQMIAAVVIGKLSAGLLAIGLCPWMARDLSKEIAPSGSASLVVNEAKVS
jgi:ethanolamine transporter